MRLAGADGQGEQSNDSTDQMQFGGMACLVCFVLGLSFSIGSVEPNEYGLARNALTGQVSDNAVRGGIHFIGPFTSFLKFPATQETIELSAHSQDGFVVQTRTGADTNDIHSGGQPIGISCSYQYQIDNTRLKHVYLNFGSFSAAHARWLLLSSNAISNEAQKFTPQDFWERRQAVSLAMQESMNKTLWDEGFISIVRFQVLKIHFADKYEESITAVQVAEQQKVVNEYSQNVTVVLQSIEVMNSEYNANISNISATATADAMRMVGTARKDAFVLKQAMKAKKYAELKKTMSFHKDEFKEYFKIKALQHQLVSGKVAVGMSNILMKTDPPASSSLSSTVGVASVGGARV